MNGKHTTFWLTVDHNLFSQVWMFPQLFTGLDSFPITLLKRFWKVLIRNTHKPMYQTAKLLKIRLQSLISHWLFPLKTNLLFKTSLLYAYITSKTLYPLASSWKEKKTKQNTKKGEERLFITLFHVVTHWFYDYTAQVCNMLQESQLWPMGL